MTVSSASSAANREEAAAKVASFFGGDAIKDPNSKKTDDKKPDPVAGSRAFLGQASTTAPAGNSAKAGAAGGNKEQPAPQAAQTLDGLGQIAAGLQAPRIMAPEGNPSQPASTPSTGEAPKGGMTISGSDRKLQEIAKEAGVDEKDVPKDIADAVKEGRMSPEAAAREIKRREEAMKADKKDSSPPAGVSVGNTPAEKPPKVIAT